MLQEAGGERIFVPVKNGQGREGRKERNFTLRERETLGERECLGDCMRAI